MSQSIERKQWLASLKAGDFVAVPSGHCKEFWEVVSLTARRINLQSRSTDPMFDFPFEKDSVRRTTGYGEFVGQIEAPSEADIAALERADTLRQIFATPWCAAGKPETYIRWLERTVRELRHGA